MRIAFFLGIFPALSETFVIDQITGLIDRGHEVDIYATGKPDNPKMHASVSKYNLLDRTYYRPSMPENFFVRYLKGLWLFLVNFFRDPQLLIRSLNVFRYGKPAASLRYFYCAIPFLGRSPSYDILHCHFGMHGLIGLYMRNLGALSGKLVTTFHGYDVNGAPRKFGQDLYQQLFQTGDLYTVNTTFTADKALALGCPQEKLIKLPIGVNLSEYPAQAHPFPPQQPIEILTVGRLVEKKGIEYSIKAVAKAIASHANLRYRIVGEGPLRTSLEELINQLGLSDQIQLVGGKTKEEVRQLYAKAHIFILSSVTAANGDQEGQGLVLQEAQAMGIPVLSTLHNGIPDGILDGKTGFLVPERDIDALAEKLQYLIEHPEAHAVMGKAGRAFIETHYDIDKLNNHLVLAYQALLDSSEPTFAEDHLQVPLLN